MLFTQNKFNLHIQPTVTPGIHAPDHLSIAISSLQSRVYIPVPIYKVQNVASNVTFSSYILSYTVDSLREFALLNIPNSPKPFGGYPVVIIDHGYIIPSQYNTIASYQTITNFFAENGYIVIKPDYRGNGNSQGANDPLQRYEYPLDVLTLLASLKNIPQANTSKIYLWGHSMGGEVTLTVMEVLGKQLLLGKGVKAVVLWAPVTDPAKWFGKENIQKIPEAVLTPFPYTKTFQILGQPSDNSFVWQSINPLRYLSDISIPIQLNHGTADPTVPYSWSEELDKSMKKLGKSVTFVSYPGGDHNLAPDTYGALENSLEFFKSY